MPDWITGTAIGAAVGSGLSVWWRKPATWLVQFSSGFFIGWWGGDYAIVYFGLPETIETARAVGCILGLIGFSLMEQIMVIRWGDIAGKIMDKAASMRGAGK